MRSLLTRFRSFLPVVLPVLWPLGAGAGIQVTHERVRSDEATAGYEFRTVPRPMVNDAAAGAVFRVIQGTPDANGAGVDVLKDGQVAPDEDSPSRSFFFRAGSGGGRLLVDLQEVLEITQVNSFSWHAGERGPQVYTLYGASGGEPGFSLEVGEAADPTSAGWTRLASVDTRPGDFDDFGGQYGVCVADSAAGTALGRFRHLLFVVGPTHSQGPFGQTFFSEIDVVRSNGPAPEYVKGAGGGEGIRVVEIDEGRTRILIDTSAAPDLASWVDSELVPVIREWYPEIVRMLPSPGYEAPRRVTIVFVTEGEGVAAASGARVTCWAKWFRANLEGEAKGAVVHELVHVVQQYRRRGNRGGGGGGGTRPPGWLVEGIPDYIRWFRFEPRTGGAHIRPEAVGRVRFDGSYRVSANFLNWVTSEYGPQVYRELNAAMREGRYQERLWQDLTGHTAEELGAAWKADLLRQRSR